MPRHARHGAPARQPAAGRRRAAPGAPAVPAAAARAAPGTAGPPGADGRRHRDELQGADPVLHPQLGRRALGGPGQLPRRRRLRRARSARRCCTRSSSPAPSRVLSVGLCWLLGTAAAVFMQETFRGRGLLRALFLTPYALPVYAAVITWAFMFQRDNGLVNHVLHDQLHLTDGRPFWLIGDNSFVALLVGLGLADLAVRLPHPDGRAAEHPRASCTRRRPSTAPASGSRSAGSPCRRCGRSTRCWCWCCSCGRSTTSTRRTCCSASPRREAGRPDLHPHLPVVVRHLELRHRLGHVRAAAALPAGGDGRSTCWLTSRGRRTPMPRPPRAVADGARRAPSSGPGGSSSPCWPSSCCCPCT